MWVLVMYDFPTETKKHRKAALIFRKNLLKDGFNMLQYSMYSRYCNSIENTNTHCRRIKSSLPKYGSVIILQVTDNQFNRIDLYKNAALQKVDIPPDYLTFF